MRRVERAGLGAWRGGGGGLMARPRTVLWQGRLGGEGGGGGEGGRGGEGEGAAEGGGGGVLCM